MWRSMLAEFNTHRDFSRNSASSRAVPVQKMIERVLKDPYIPSAFSVNMPGMSAQEYYEPGTEQYELAKHYWLQARDNAVKSVESLLRLGVHKQDANRLIEAFMHHTLIVSSTRWDNFLSQRDHEAAQPQMTEVAVAIKKALFKSIPTTRPYSDSLLDKEAWHLPLIQPDEWDLDLKDLLKISVARCARVSYLTHDGKRSTEDDLRMYHDRLLGQIPPHLSPFEHTAHSDKKGSGNFHGWYQARRHYELKDWLYTALLS